VFAEGEAMAKTVRNLAFALALGASMIALPALAQTTASVDRNEAKRSTFNSQEILVTGHRFFGKASRGLAEVIEAVFRDQGEPDAYIVGEEGAGAIIGGLRYGEGTIYYKSGEKRHIYWQGPSIGFDFGGNGSRSMVLVYNSTSPQDLDDNRFMGIEGSAYVIGGLGVNYQQYKDIVLAPIRTGVGARLGANVGYLKYSSRPDWNPF
jgi:hypothetical protein